MKQHKSRFQSGVSMIDVLVGLSVFIVVSVALVGGLSNLRSGEQETIRQLQAGQQARELIEIGYNLSVQNWSQFSQLEGKYRSTLTDSGLVQLEPGVETETGQIQSWLEVETVYRDETGQIADQGEIDPESKLITATATWGDQAKQQVEYQLLVTQVLQEYQP